MFEYAETCTGWCLHHRERPQYWACCESQKVGGSYKGIGRGSSAMCGRLQPVDPGGGRKVPHPPPLLCERTQP